MNPFLRTIKRNPLTSFLLGGFLLSIVLSSRDIQTNMASITAVKQITAANSAKQLELQASEQAKHQAATIAESRYKSGCIMVVAEHAPGSFTAITEGMPVIDVVRQVPLSPGQIVCDANGLTGEIVLDGQSQPVVGKTAFTGNRDVIEQRMQEVNAAYQTPGVQ